MLRDMLAWRASFGVRHLTAHSLSDHRLLRQRLVCFGGYCKRRWLIVCVRPGRRAWRPQRWINVPGARCRHIRVRWHDKHHRTQEDLEKFIALTVSRGAVHGRMTGDAVG